MSRCEALCARSEQSSGDIDMKLRKWGIAANDAKTILRHLVGEGYIDDTRYARAYVRDKFRFSGWGRLKIAYNLRLKHIDNDTIALALGEIDAEEYKTKLKSLVATKFREVKSRPPMKAREAVLRFVAQRGFEADLSISVVNELIEDQTDYE